MFIHYLYSTDYIWMYAPHMYVHSCYIMYVRVLYFVSVELVVKIFEN